MKPIYEPKSAIGSITTSRTVLWRKWRNRDEEKEEKGANIMNENYIVINGKKIELTEEQLKQLGIEPKKKRKNPFERVPKGEVYFFADYDKYYSLYEKNDCMDECLFATAKLFQRQGICKSSHTSSTTLPQTAEICV